MTHNEQKLFRKASDLLESAKLLSNKAGQDYEHSVYLYVIARNMVAIFEVKIRQIPFQVWNEYRNALDHFMRYVSDSLNRNTDQLKKMEGHLQRAVLDTSKYLCIEMLDAVKKLLEQEDQECLRMVDNGEMYEQMHNKIRQTSDKLELAKILDNKLGEGAKHDTQIVSLYLEPAFESLNILDFISDKRADIERVSRELKAQKEHAVREESKKWYSWSSLKQSIWQNIVWLAIGGISVYFLELI